jgi:uncharacterized protein
VFRFLETFEAVQFFQGAAGGFEIDQRLAHVERTEANGGWCHSASHRSGGRLFQRRACSARLVFEERCRFIVQRDRHPPSHDLMVGQGRIRRNKREVAMSDYDKPSKAEDEYFARQELERRKKWAQEQAAKMQTDQKEELKQLHWMKCPKCGMDLKEIEVHGVKVDQCASCGGVFLDAGEMEQISKHDEGGVMGRVFSMFR